MAKAESLRAVIPVGVSRDALIGVAPPANFSHYTESLLCIAAKSLAGSTVEKYECGARYWLKIAEAANGPDVDIQTLEEYDIAWALIKGAYSGKSGSTVRGWLAALRKLQTVGQLRDALGRCSASTKAVDDVMECLRRGATHAAAIRGAITPDMAEQLIEYIATQIDPKSDEFRLHVRAIYFIMTTGMRLQEALLFRYGDVVPVHDSEDAFRLGLLLRIDKGHHGEFGMAHKEVHPAVGDLIAAAFKEDSTLRGAPPRKDARLLQDWKVRNFRRFTKGASRAYHWPSDLMWDGPHCMRHGNAVAISARLPRIEEAAEALHMCVEMAKHYGRPNEDRVAAAARREEAAWRMDVEIARLCQEEAFPADHAANVQWHEAATTGAVDSAGALRTLMQEVPDLAPRPPVATPQPAAASAASAGNPKFRFSSAPQAKAHVAETTAAPTRRLRSASEEAAAAFDAEATRWMGPCYTSGQNRGVPPASIPEPTPSPQPVRVPLAKATSSAPTASSHASAAVPEAYRRTMDTVLGAAPAAPSPMDAEAHAEALARDAAVAALSRPKRARSPASGSVVATQAAAAAAAPPAAPRGPPNAEAVALLSKGVNGVTVSKLKALFKAQGWQGPKGRLKTEMFAEAITNLSGANT